MDGTGICWNKLQNVMTCAQRQLIKGSVSSKEVLTSHPKFMYCVAWRWHRGRMVLSGSRKLSQQRHELPSILITVRFIEMQGGRLHLAMRSSDDHTTVNRGEWVGVCSCLLYELQPPVCLALGDIYEDNIPDGLGTYADSAFFFFALNSKCSTATWTN